MIRTGRAWGKTETGVHTTIMYALENPGSDCLVVVPDYNTWDRNICWGRAGFMNVIPKELLYHKNPYNGSTRIIKLFNGSRIHGVSATNPDKLRSGNFHFSWIDELAYCNNPKYLWDEVNRVTRVSINGSKVWFMITSTPNQTRIMRELAEDDDVVETRGSTFENAALPKEVLESYKKKWLGTKMAAQELYGEFIEWGDGALWNIEQINRHRITMDALPHLSDIVVAIDPAVTSNDESDETGIVVMGKDETTEHLYLLDDLSCRCKPSEWAEIAVRAYHQWDASLIVGERNNGGDMVEEMIRNYDDTVEYEGVWASRGKKKRAEPVALLAEQGKIHHVGEFPKLEKQLVEFDGDIREESPDRFDAFMWAGTSLSHIEPRILIGGA